MTTDALKSIKRRRRRRICRGIRRTIYWTVGAILAAFVIGYATWFRFGWTDLPLRCVDWDFGVARPIYGELRPEVADALEISITSFYGEGTVKQVAPGRLRVRPVVVYFGDYGRLRALTTHLTDRFSQIRDYPATGPGTTDDCQIVQRYLMAGGRAASCDGSWIQFFMADVIKQDAWPAMTRFFRVPKPASSQSQDLSMDWHTRVFTDPRDAVAPEDIAALDCGAPISERFFWWTILTAGAVYGFFASLWPF